MPEHVNRFISVLCVALTVASCARAPKPRSPQPAPASPQPTSASPPPSADKRTPSSDNRLARLVPLPQRVEPAGGEPFRFTSPITIAVSDGNPLVMDVAAQLQTFVRRASGLRPTILAAREPAPSANVVALTLDANASTGDEGYDLTVTPAGVALRAKTAAGLFYGVQTLRQLLPESSEYDALLFRAPPVVTLPAVHIVDAPRYAWRGAMLDVARHFFSIDEVKRYIDLIAMYKINRLHLHLADDQGWRLEIKSWPELARHGGASEVGGGPGGYYTQEQYTDLVDYAAAHFVTIVPEIDMPGHTNALLSSYADLNCNGTAPAQYTGTEVGFSALCVDLDVTYKIIDDIVREIVALTPGPYFHAGGDEVKTLTPDQYKRFVERVQTIVQSHGKQMIGWDEVSAATLLPTSIVQHWRPDASKQLLAGSPHLILSPADRAYLDMKYDDSTLLGLNWAGNVSLRKAYDWDPEALVPGAKPGAVLGVEAPVWSETVANMHDVEFMLFPRLPAVAEIGWTPQDRRSWDNFRERLAPQAPRWTALGINFYRAPEIAWPANIEH
jgi:hexosaminidase